MGGKAVLSGLTLAEKQDLSGFLQKDYTENKTVTVSAGLLEKCLAESRFSGISAEMLLEAYFGEKLTVKKEEKEKEEKGFLCRAAGWKGRRSGGNVAERGSGK